ncbi:hypothetical protein [Moorena producens]|nr:hypothetical protein [Moorena producens]
MRARSALSRQWSVVSGQWSVVSGQPLAVGQRLFAERGLSP